jgi:hypothetical protein
MVADSLFGGLITSKMRIRILMRLFLNPGEQTYLRELSGEFKASPGQVRDELGQLIAAGLLTHEKRGRQIHYQANMLHPLYPELHSMVKKALGMDRIIDSIVERLGSVEQVILLDDYAAGRDTGLIDLLLIGDINRSQLADLVRKTESYIHRKIRTLVMSAEELRRHRKVLDGRKQLVLWESKR